MSFIKYFVKRIESPVVKYAFVGIANTATDIVVFAILLYIFDFHLLLANILAFFVAVSQSYLINSNWTFEVKNREVNNRSRIFYFLLVNLGGLFISSTLILFASGFMFPIVAKLLATVVVFIYGYGLNRYFVFR